MPHLYRCTDAKCEFYVIADSFGYAELAWRMAMADADGVEVDDATSPDMITLVADETEVIVASVGCGESPCAEPKDPPVVEHEDRWAAPLELPDGEYRWFDGNFWQGTYLIGEPKRYWKTFTAPKYEGVYVVLNGLGILKAPRKD